MLIIADHKIGDEALRKLRTFGEVLLFPESNNVYPAISSHPDIFLFQSEGGLLVAPNTPKAFLKELEGKGVDFVFGKNEVGFKYPETVYYNAAYRDGLLVCNASFCDETILSNLNSATKVDSKQGYARCNHLILDRNHVVSSDLPTVKKLNNALYVDPNSILLPDFEHGFFGGCCGVFNTTVVINGSLSSLPNEIEIRTFISDAGFNIVELHQRALLDIGSIFFIPQQ